MAQSGYTPILIYASGTATNVPAAGDLTSGASGAELAINYADGKLYYKDGSGNVQLIASKAGASGDVVGPSSATDNAIVRFDGTTGKLVQNSVVTIADSTGDVAGVGALTMGGNLTLSGGTANGVVYLNGSKVATSGSALTFDGTNLTTTGYAAGNGLRSLGGNAVRFYNAANANWSQISAPAGTGDMQFDTGAGEQMRLTSTGLGIGTSSPSVKLQVGWSSDQLKFTNPSAGFKQIGASYTGYVSGNDYSAIILGTDGSSGGKIQFSVTPSSGSLTTAATIDQYGNLGLGVTPSAWNASFRALQVSNSCFYNNGSADTFLGANFYNDTGGTNRYTTSAHAAAYGQVDGAHQWFTAPSGTAGNAITFSQVMTLDASGNLGVGATSLSNKLTVIGSVYFSDAITTDVQITTASSLSTIGCATNTPLAFKTNNTERARITSGGLLLIGNTTGANLLTVGAAYGGTPNVESAGVFQGVGNCYLTIGAGSSSDSGILFADSGSNNVGVVGYNHSTNVMTFNTNGSERARITSGGFFKASNSGTYVSSTGTFHELRSDTADAYTVRITQSNATPLAACPALLSFTGSAPNDTTAWFLDCTDNTARRAYIRSNGGLSNYQSNNTDLSDIRTKRDISAAASMWSKIGALEIVTFKYKDQTHDDVNVGVIAQQVESVEPVWVDADGWGDETPEDGVPLKTVYTKDITFAAIKALQEAMTRIELLEAKVSALEGTQP